MNLGKNAQIKILDCITDDIIQLRKDVYVQEKGLIKE